MPILLKPHWVKHDGDAAIYSIDVHPDNTKFATAGADRRVRIWNMLLILEPDKEKELPKQLCSIVGHESSVTCVRWSPNGLYLASASNDTCVGIADRRMGEINNSLNASEVALENWKFKHILRGHSIDVWDLAWSPDSRKIASSGHDGKIIVWDITQNGKMVVALECHTSIVKGLAWDPIGRYLASQEDTSVIFWRTENWKVSKIVTESFTNASESPIFKRLSWSPDGSIVIAASGVKSKKNIAPQIIRESWDHSKCELVGHGTPVTAVHFNPVLFATKDKPASCCASTSLDGTVGLWLTSRNSAFAVLKNMFYRPSSDLRWSPNGDVLLMSSLDGTISACVFGSRELGRKLTFEQHQKHIREIFGDISSPAKLIESPELLKLHQKQLENETAHIQKTPNISIPATAKPESRSPINNKTFQDEIERLPSGKQKIVPICIKSQPAYTYENQLSTDTLTSNVFPNFVETKIVSLSNDPQITETHFKHNSDPTSSKNTDIKNLVSTEDSSGRAENINDDHEGRNTELYGLAAASTVDKNELHKKRARDGTDTDHENEELRKRRSEDIKTANKKSQKRNLRPKIKSKSNTEELDNKSFSDMENLEDYNSSSTRLVETKIVLPIPNLNDRILYKLTTSNEFCESSTNEQFLEAYVTYDETNYTGVSTTLTLLSNEEVLWKEEIFGRVILITGNLDYFFAVGTLAGEVIVYSTSGRRLLPPLMLSSEGVACLESNGPYLLAAAACGRLCMWDISSCIIQLETSAESLCNSNRAESEESTTTKEEKNQIERFIVTNKGQAVAVMKNGKTFVYSQLMACWCCVYDLNWQRKMDIVAVGDGPLGKIQKEINKTFDIPSFTSYIHKKDPLEDQILNISHLETQVASAMLLGDSKEYLWWLTHYVTKLVQLVNTKKLGEIGNWFVGTLSNRSGEHEDWDPYILGVPKKKILSQIILIMAKEPELQRLVSTLDSLYKSI